MTTNRIQDPARTMFQAYCNVNAYDIEALLRSKPERLELLRQQLIALIDGRIDARDEYEALTGEDFDTAEDFLAHLRELLFRISSRSVEKD